MTALPRLPLPSFVQKLLAFANRKPAGDAAQSASPDQSFAAAMAAGRNQAGDYEMRMGYHLGRAPTS